MGVYNKKIEKYKDKECLQIKKLPIIFYHNNISTSCVHKINLNNMIFKFYNNCENNMWCNIMFVLNKYKPKIKRN